MLNQATLRPRALLPYLTTYAPIRQIAVSTSTRGPHSQKRHSAVKEVRGKGLMIAMQWEEDCEGISSTSAYRELLERGFLVEYAPAGNLLRFYPPLTIGEEKIARLLENLDQVLQASK